jgi:hypothetical protein
VNKALAEAGGKGTGSAIANSFQRWGSGVADHSTVQRNDVKVQTRGRGPNETGGHVGFATGKTRMHKGKLQLQMLGGNQNDSVSEQWVDSNKNLMVRRSQSLTGQVPTAADTIKNVPPAVAPGIGAGDARMPPWATLRSTSTATAMIRKRWQRWCSVVSMSR